MKRVQKLKQKLYHQHLTIPEKSDEHHTEEIEFFLRVKFVQQTVAQQKSTDAEESVDYIRSSEEQHR